MPKVSVIIPVYGVEKFIERCARSLFEQTLQDIEYLFIDDCTPDRSMEVLKHVLEDYPARKEYVVIHRMERNSGQAIVRKWGLQNATGEYIVHCDSDDWVDTDMYRAMYKKAVLDDADIVICDFNYTDEDAYVQRVKSCYSTNCEQFLSDLLYQKISWAVWNKLVRKKLYDSLVTYPSYAMGEDMVITTQLILNCNKISYIGLGFYNYYINPSSLMNTRTRKQCMNKYLELKKNTNILLPLLKHKLNKHFCKRIERVLRYNNTMPLLTYIYEKDFFILWKREMKPCYGLLFDCKVKSMFKFMYVLVLFKIYPFYKRLK